MIDEVADSSDILGSFSTPQKTARVKSMLIATSGISPTSPTRRPGSGKIKGMMDKDEHGDRDVDMDEDEDEEDGMGSPSVRASRKRASAVRLGLSELESEDEASGRVAKAPKIRVSLSNLSIVSTTWPGKQVRWQCRPFFFLFDLGPRSHSRKSNE